MFASRVVRSSGPALHRRPAVHCVWTLQDSENSEFGLVGLIRPEIELG